MTLTEEERRFLSNLLITLQQNANLRDYYGADIIQSIIGKLQSIVVSLTQQEIGLLNVYLTYQREGLARLTDQRLQHILIHQNHQGFGAPGAQVPGPGNAGAGGGAHDSFFHSGKQYQLCIAIIGKLSS